MKNRDFIITSLQVWEIKIGSTIKNTAMELSKQNRVLYFDTPMNYFEWMKASDEKRKGGITKINSNLWIVQFPFPVFPLNKIPFLGLFNFINKLNNKRIAKGMLKVMNDFEFHNCIHLIDTDIYRSQYLKELVKPALSIYYCRDFVIGTNYWKKNGSRLEPLLASKSDVVLANSSLFAKRLQQYNTNTYVIETGVNLKLYDAYKDWDIPTDIEHIPHPIVGYTGMVLTLRLDIELIYQIVVQTSHISYVFVGPTDATFDKHPLHQLPNVYFLGRKEVSCLPAYINAFDVCINPQAINDITMGNYPLKIDEYLAMGKPTVATRTDTMQRVFGNYVFLATNKGEYLHAIEQALVETTNGEKRATRIAFAQTHSWTSSVSKIYQAIEQTEKNK